MDCRKCGSENPDSKKFCRECGAKLTRICLQCGSEIIARDKFCGECGHDLTRPPEEPSKHLSADEKLEKIKRFLPKDLTEKILAREIRSRVNKNR